MPFVKFAYILGLYFTSYVELPVPNIVYTFSEVVSEFTLTLFNVAVTYYPAFICPEGVTVNLGIIIVESELALGPNIYSPSKIFLWLIFTTPSTLEAESSSVTSTPITGNFADFVVPAIVIDRFYPDKSTANPQGFSSPYRAI
nr:MAG TPA: hypothetical protein [Bacteriophage sp.]